MIKKSTYPSIDLHCYLRGTLQPYHAMQLAKKHNLTLPIHIHDQNYKFSSFEQFLTLYDVIGHVVKTGNDLREIAQNYLISCAQNGSIYIEFMLSPAHSMKNGIAFADQISAVSDAIDFARETEGIEAGIIITAVRHRQIDEAIEMASLAARHNNSKIIGFGLTGNERINHAHNFQGAFQIAKDAGLHLTAHTGEWLDARSVLDTVNTLQLSRIGHGIRAAEDDAILQELREKHIGFEICLTSNLRLGAVNSLETHPVKKIINAGCLVSLSTDDPAYFETTPNNELQVAVEKCSINYDNIKKIIFDSVKMSFCSNQTKKILKNRINEILSI